MKGLNTVDEAIVVLNGQKIGKIIQLQDCGKWLELERTHNEGLPNFFEWRYRVKPDPKYIYLCECSESNQGYRVLCNGDCIKAVKYCEVIE